MSEWGLFFGNVRPETGRVEHETAKRFGSRALKSLQRAGKRDGRKKNSDGESRSANSLASIFLSYVESGSSEVASRQPNMARTPGNVHLGWLRSIECPGCSSGPHPELGLSVAEIPSQGQLFTLLPCPRSPRTLIVLVDRFQIKHFGAKAP